MSDNYTEEFGGTPCTLCGHGDCQCEKEEEETMSDGKYDLANDLEKIMEYNTREGGIKAERRRIIKILNTYKRKYNLDLLVEVIKEIEGIK